MTDLSLTPAREHDLPEAAAVLAEAFRDDPVLAAIVRPGARRDERLRRLFLGFLAAGPFATGSVDLARRPGEDRILGVAAWEGPRPGPALPGLVRRLPDFVAALGLRGIPRALSILGRLSGHRPRSPHWYLGEVGVLSAARGLGVGGALLRSRLEVLDRTGSTAYLESSTPDNRRLYGRLGFVETAPISGIPGADPVGMMRVPGRVTA